MVIRIRLPVDQQPLSHDASVPAPWQTQISFEATKRRPLACRNPELSQQQVTVQLTCRVFDNTRPMREHCPNPEDDRTECKSVAWFHDGLWAFCWT
jgi:hypothetical protein